MAEHFDISKEKWLDKLPFPSGYISQQLAKRKSFYTNKTLRKYYNPVYVYDLIKHLTIPFNEWKAYELGIIDENGKELRKAKSNEQLYWNYFLKIVAFLKKRLIRAFSQSRLKYMIGRLILIRENKENYFDKFIYLIEELEKTKDKRMFDLLYEIVSVGDISSGDVKIGLTKEYNDYLNSKDNRILTFKEWLKKNNK